MNYANLCSELICIMEGLEERQRGAWVRAPAQIMWNGYRGSCGAQAGPAASSGPSWQAVLCSVQLTLPAGGSPHGRSGWDSQLVLASCVELASLSLLCRAFREVLRVVIPSNRALALMECRLAC